MSWKASTLLSLLLILWWLFWLLWLLLQVYMESILECYDASYCGLWRLACIRSHWGSLHSVLHALWHHPERLHPWWVPHNLLCKAAALCLTAGLYSLPCIWLLLHWTVCICFMRHADGEDVIATTWWLLLFRRHCAWMKSVIISIKQ